jgi:hypothetical protein
VAPARTQRTRRLPAWVGALAAGTAALIVLAGPAAAPPRPQRTHVDVRHVAASNSGPVMQVSFTDLELDVFVFEDELSVGARTSIEMSVLNVGLATISGITLANEVPSGFRIEETDPVASVSGNTATWSLGSLAGDEEFIVTLTIRALQVGTFTNLATLSSDATNDVTSNDQINIVASGLNQGVATTTTTVATPTTTTPLQPISGSVQDGELAATGATLNWVFAGALVMVAGGALAMEVSARVPAMATLRGPARRRRVNRPVFHPVRSSETR